jgi:type 1 fimbria pilin
VTAPVARGAAPALGISVQLSSTTTAAGRNSTVAVRGTTAPSTPCTITVTEASNQGIPPGLGPQTADGAGEVSWTWTTTAAGSWRVGLACGGANATAQFTVQ